jgi:manganese transport protein
MGAFAGPGYLVAVGYMDPGNWATDLAGGSAFGYTLLSVILLSNIMAMVLQSLSAKLGIVSGMDLAQACRAHYSPARN